MFRTLVIVAITIAALQIGLGLADLAASIKAQHVERLGAI